MPAGGFRSETVIFALHSLVREYVLWNVIGRVQGRRAQVMRLHVPHRASYYMYDSTFLSHSVSVLSSTSVCNFVESEQKTILQEEREAVSGASPVDPL